MRKLGNKGITIVEVVIAMTIISIISSVAVAISMSSIKSSNKNTLEFNAMNVSADIISIYRKSEDENDFYSLLKTVYSISDESSTSKTSPLEFTYENIKYKITWEDFTKKISIEALRTSNDKKIYSTVYNKIGDYYETETTQ